MSRRLLATRIAQASTPIATAAYTDSGSSHASAWTYDVPTTATSPKKQKTITSPSPA